jgi:UDP-N-acetylmuramate dehydrogenase
VSVPGTVGGAVVNNAGAHGSDIAASLCDAVVFDGERGAQLMTNADLDYGYRHSSLKARSDRRFLVQNPLGDYAGRLIESAGLKGFTIGGAQVSPIHANFFINTGSATASDYYALIQRVREGVAVKTGVVLELEIELIGEW